MAYGRKSRKKVVERKMYAAKLLQQFSGTLRFGKRRFHLQNGSLLYTILPIQLVIEQFYQEQFKAVDLAREQQRIEKLTAQGS